ncbi:MAG: NAD(P)H-hydrate epimerase [Candidatus Nephthysia bennettiae]|uniref:NAD(P)H-hydrate epimerase n=2 Tax=Candidatus Nephthysia bennettiae TaxID=3127016 RepID=A0A934KAS4_9BACT|nr:NAD(P)H-hydrate epimerase [Candidatus Dormibacteraeota bacterium]MBJ7611458.1 NAD(P)H-hydrate epimerase [Candidatus Dormibacteraeota bacterium]PZR95360.1 MAG: NAD(P)H-hydrate epimerase [Candidatus Dormibacteraeota bacterium]
MASERFHVPVAWLMEAAGWQLARHCRTRTLVVCGKGNNGGDGLAAARHLHRWGRLAGVACLRPDGLSGLPAEQAAALRAAGVEIDDRPDFSGAQLVLDALLGTGFSRPPEGPVADWIGAVNDSGLRVVSVDLPSGLDADSGRAEGACVSAALTVTLGLPKAGLLSGDGPARAGEVWVADIGVPFEAYAELGIRVPPHLFAMHDRFQLSAVRL